MSAPSVMERVKTRLVALKMPRALEVLDLTLLGIERGEIGAVEAIDGPFTEELTTPENSPAAATCSSCSSTPATRRAR